MSKSTAHNASRTKSSRGSRYNSKRSRVLAWPIGLRARYAMPGTNSGTTTTRRKRTTLKTALYLSCAFGWLMRTSAAYTSAWNGTEAGLHPKESAPTLSYSRTGRTRRGSRSIT
eukprot:2319154-Rhodomonas_salina.1